MLTRQLSALAMTLSLLGGVAALAPSSAWAQTDMVTPLFQTPVLKTVLDANARAFHDPAAERRETAAPAGAPLQTTYRPSPAVSRKVQARFAEFLATRTGDTSARKVAEVMAQGDPATNWARIVAADGLKPNDAADALAAYWALSWSMANDGAVSRAQTLGAREQVLGVLARNPAYGRLDDEGRQEFAETLMLNFLLQQAAFDDARQRQDAATLRRLGDAAAARFKAEAGEDLRALTLTDKGLVAKR